MNSTIRPLIVLVTFVAALLGVSVTDASAYTQTGSGRPGRALTVYQVQGAHVKMCGNCGFSPSLYIPGPVLSRSSRTRTAQDVRVQYVIERYDGGWTRQALIQNIRRISSGQGAVRMPPQQIVPTRAYYLRVRINVLWGTPGFRRILGSRIIRMSQSGDYTCQTRFPCDAGPGWVWLKQP